MELRELTVADAAATAAIEADVFAGETPWSRDVFAVQFAHPYTCLLYTSDAADE